MTDRPTSPSLTDSNPATQSSTVCFNQTQGTTQDTLSELLRKTGKEAQARRKGSRAQTWPLSSDSQAQSRQPIVTEEEEGHEGEEEEEEEDKSYKACYSLAARARSNTVPLTGQATEKLHKASFSSTSAQQNKSKTIWAQQANPLSTTDIRDFALEEKAVAEMKKAGKKSRKKGKKPSGSIKAIELATASLG